MGILTAFNLVSILKDPYNKFIILKLLDDIKYYNYKKYIDAP